MRRHFVAALFTNANLFETILSQSNAIVDNTLLEPDYDNLNQIQFHRQSTGQAFTTETVPVNPGTIEHNSNGEFIKFLKALVTTIIAIILSHLWYIDQRDDDSRQRRFLNHNFYDFTRSDSGFYSKRSLQNPGSDIGNTSGTRQKYRPHKSRHSSKSGRSSKYNKRSLANRQTNLECITESEDEAIAELNYLNENSSPAANSVVSSTTSLNGASFPSSDEENENYKPETKPLDQKTEIEKTEAKDLSAEGELKQTETNSELASQEQPKMSPSTNSTPTNTLTSPDNTHGGYPAPYHQKSQNLVPQTLMDSGRIHLSRSPRFYDVKRESRDPKFNPGHMNGNQHYSLPESARSSDPRSYKKKPEVLPEEKKIVIANELTETDKRRTSIAEAYPYIKDGSNSSELVIGITRNESFLKHKQVTDKVLTDIQELQQEFEENQKMFLSHRFSFDSEEKAGTSFSFDGHLNASCLSSNDRIVFEGLSKEDIKTHKDISIRRKTQESMSSDDNYSVSTREMLDDITDVVVMIRCRYKPCGKIKELKIARTCYKMCHNCFTYYCSKSCRENHWERHKIKCVYSRVNSTCKNILNSIRHSQSTIATLSDYAESQYDINGRGGVLLKFSSHPDADNFVRNHDHMPDFEYITGSKLEDPELCQLYFAEIGPHLSQIITSYDPLAKFLVIIAVDLSAYKESNQKVIPRITSRFMCKYLAFRIFKDPNPVKPGDINLGAPKERTKALVATSIVKQNSFNTQKDRKLFFSNLQRNLKNKGVNIRVDFPFVYQQLCNYVETGEHFEPITLYPHDPATGQQFMCLIMPDSQPNFLSWVSEQT